MAVTVDEAGNQKKTVTSDPSGCRIFRRQFADMTDLTYRVAGDGDPPVGNGR
jgi:hypothetical protein